MALLINIIRMLVRIFLAIVSLLSGISGAYGIFVFISNNDFLIQFISKNTDNWFLAFSIYGTSIGDLLTDYTSKSIERIWLPIILIVVGVITWITQVGLAKKQLYQRIRFSHPWQASPLAWIMVIAGAIATVYVIINWNSIDPFVASLVIVANIIAIMWNISIIK